MRVLVAFAITDLRSLDFLGRQKDRVVPKEQRRSAKNPNAFEVATNFVDLSCSQSTTALADFFLRRLESYDYIALLYQRSLGEIVAPLSLSLLTSPIDTESCDSLSLNLIHARVTRTLRLFRRIDDLVGNSDTKAFFGFPLRNFSGKESAGLRLLSEKAGDSSAFVDGLERVLAELRKRFRPRRNSNYSVRFIVDDKARFFRLGTERHSRHETGGEHNLLCDLSARLRLGVKLDPMRHFNVSEGEGDRTTIHGDFNDCHDTLRPIAGVTHLNMFSNDYF